MSRWGWAGQRPVVHARQTSHSGPKLAMLQKNPLCPPLPSQSPRAAVSATAAASAGRFVSADDFDATGVLAGMDPCESRYWWMPEMYGPDAEAAVGGQPLADALARGPRQATRRSTSRATAAA